MKFKTYSYRFALSLYKIEMYVYLMYAVNIGCISGGNSGSETVTNGRENRIGANNIENRIAALETKVKELEKKIVG